MNPAGVSAIGALVFPSQLRPQLSFGPDQLRRSVLLLVIAWLQILFRTAFRPFLLRQYLAEMIYATCPPFLATPNDRAGIAANQDKDGPQDPRRRSSGLSGRTSDLAGRCGILGRVPALGVVVVMLRISGLT